MYRVINAERDFSSPRRTVRTELKDIVNGYGIFRCEEKRVDFDGNMYGHALVWYDVCADSGDGDTIDSFKTLAEAYKCARTS